MFQVTLYFQLYTNLGNIRRSVWMAEAKEVFCQGTVRKWWWMRGRVFLEVVWTRGGRWRRWERRLIDRWRVTNRRRGIQMSMTCQSLPTIDPVLLPYNSADRAIPPVFNSSFHTKVYVPYSHALPHACAARRTATVTHASSYGTPKKRHIPSHNTNYSRAHISASSDASRSYFNIGLVQNYPLIYLIWPLSDLQYNLSIMWRTI